MYAVAIGKPSYAEIGPFAIGLSLFASATSGAPQNRPKHHICTLASHSTSLTNTMSCNQPVLFSRDTLPSSM